MKKMMVGETTGEKSDLVRQAARLIVEEAFEAEVDDVLGRGFCEHGSRGRGDRNGHRIGRVKPAEGVIKFAAARRYGGAPSLADARSAVVSRNSSRSPSRCARVVFLCATSRRLSTMPPGDARPCNPPKLAASDKEDFMSRHERDYPNATSCSLDDFEACIAHLRCQSRIGA